MIKDRAIKEMALRYTATRRWYPHMEVEVAPPARVAQRVSLVTDIDVLAVVPDPVLGTQSVLFDCKTKAAESGANRSLWLAGLMRHFGAEQAFCVLKKANIDSDHRQVAQELGVLLIPEDEFETFAKVSAASELTKNAAIASIDAWEKVADLKKRFPALGPLLGYRAGEFWRMRASHTGCRKVVANVLEARAEFDPVHVEHEVLFGDLVSMFGLSLATLVTSIFRIMLLPASGVDFEQAVRMKLYGGREAYEQQNRLFKLLKQSRHGDDFDDDLAPPEWSRFVKLLRQLLDDPNAVVRASLIIKESAFGLIAGDGEYLSVLAKNDGQAARFAILIADYFSRATRLPPEFGVRIEQRLLALA